MGSRKKNTEAFRITRGCAPSDSLIRITGECSIREPSGNSSQITDQSIFATRPGWTAKIYPGYIDRSHHSLLGRLLVRAVTFTRALDGRGWGR